MARIWLVVGLEVVDPCSWASWILEVDAVLHQNIYQLEPWEVVEEVPSFPDVGEVAGNLSEQDKGYPLVALESWKEVVDEEESCAISKSFRCKQIFKLLTYGRRETGQSPLLFLGGLPL